MKSCTRCRKVKPAESFPTDKKTNDGLSSWCKDCKLERTREWRRDNPAAVRADTEGKSRYADSSAYARDVCAHIANHAQRAIKRIERQTLREAPPQLTAIHELAMQLSGTAKPQGRTHETAACPHCGTIFRKKRRDQRFCDRKCGANGRYAHLKATNPEAVRQRNKRLNDRKRRIGYVRPDRQNHTEQNTAPVEAIRPSTLRAH